MASFIDSPFPTKAEYDANLQMPTDAAAAAWHAAEKCSQASGQQQQVLGQKMKAVSLRPTVPPLASTILVPTDFSENAEVAYPFAKAWAKKLDASIVLVHVTQDSSVPSWWQSSEQSTVERTPTTYFSNLTVHNYMTEEALIKLGPLLKDCVSAHGVPPVEICKVAERYENCFIVIATHGHSLFTQTIRPSLGSVVERVVRLASCPVLAVHADDKLQIAGMKMILATDFSECASHAYPLAARIAKKFDAEIILCYVECDPVPTGPGDTPAFIDAQAQFKERAREEATKISKSMVAQGVESEFKFVLSSGYSVSSTLVDEAKNHDADLIVIATHGSTSVIRRLLIGSVAESVLRTAKCPVFTVH